VILGVWLDGSLLWGLLRKGELSFSREEDSGAEVLLAFVGFVDQCRKEFPDLCIQKGVLVADPQLTLGAQNLPGVELEVRELASLVRSVQERAAFGLSPVAFLDLLLAGDRNEAAFDLSPRLLKAERERLKVRSLAGHFIALVGIILAGLFIKAGAEFHQRKAVVDSLRIAVEQSAVRVKELEDKARTVASIEGLIAERTLITGVFRDLARAIPGGVRLSRADFKEGTLDVQGEAQGLESARTFMTNLAGTGVFQDVRLVNMDKRPTEKENVVSFRMKARVP
jgi:type IV pilus assembly protein PilN